MRTASILAAALLAAVSPLRAQDTLARRPIDPDVVVLDITVDPAANERHTVFLQKGVAYRARFNGPGITIRMRSRENRRLPFIVNVTPVPDAAGATEYEIYPDYDGDVEFTPIGNAGRVPVRFLMWRDVRAAQRRERMAGVDKLAIGFEGSLGSHPDYLSAGVLGAKAGATYGICVAVRHRPASSGRFSGCVLGVEGMTGDDDPQLTTFFMEPRFGLVRSAPGRTAGRAELGVLGRLGLVSRSGGGSVEGFFGLGAYGAQDLVVRPDGSGLRAMLAFRIDGHSRSETVSDPIPTSQSRLHLFPILQGSFGLYF